MTSEKKLGELTPEQVELLEQANRALTVMANLPAPQRKAITEGLRAAGPWLA